MILAPLEQFKVFTLYSLVFLSLDLSLTNVLIICLLLFIFFCLFSFVLKKYNVQLKIFNHYYYFPTVGQFFVEFLNKFISQFVRSSLNKKGECFYPFVSSLFVLILLSNLIGLIPYSFTLTSHIIITFALSFAIYIGINIICIRKFGILYFSLFLPSGTSFILALLLVPIELISYLFKPISLSIRLFANMMAGHTLLKVIAGFASDLMYSTGLFFIIHIIPLAILFPLFGLECGVALIQSFVFSILVCIYINDALNFH